MGMDEAKSGMRHLKERNHLSNFAKKRKINNNKKKTLIRMNNVLEAHK